MSELFLGFVGGLVASGITYTIYKGSHQDLKEEGYKKGYLESEEKSKFEYNKGFQDGVRRYKDSEFEEYSRMVYRKNNEIKNLSETIERLEKELLTSNTSMNVVCICNCKDCKKKKRK